MTVPQQDSAPLNTSTVLEDHLGEDTPRFIQKDKWFIQIADFNPRDCAIWDSLKKEKIHQGLRRTLAEKMLKNRIILPCEILIGKIRKSISVWKKPLRLFIVDDKSHIEHRPK